MQLKKLNNILANDSNRITQVECYRSLMLHEYDVEVSWVSKQIVMHEMYNHT